MSILPKSLMPFLLLLLLVTACGDAQTAKVTLLTGLENQKSAANFMERIANVSPRVDPGICTQTQVYSGFAPHSDQSDNSNSISNFPVGLITPRGSSYSDPATWLAASQMDAVNLTVPTKTLLDFAIIGSLFYSSLQMPDGTCPLMDPSGSGTYYSLLAHSVTTVSGDTTLPLNLWLNKAIVGVATDLPNIPTSAACTNSNGDDGLTSQACPNENFNLVQLKCPNCSTLGVQFAQMDYFFSTSGQHVSQRFPITQALTAIVGGANVVPTLVIPSIKPLRISLVGANGVVIENTTINNDSGTSIFSNADGTTDASTVATLLNSNSSATPSPTPISLTDTSSFGLTVTESTATTVAVAWNYYSGAINYVVDISQDNFATSMSCSAVTGTSTSVSLGTTGCSYHSGVVNYFRVRAISSGSTTLSTSGDTTYYQ